MTGAGQGAPTISDEKLEALRWLTSAPGDFLVSQRDGHCIHFALVELRELRASHATLLLEVEGLKAALDKYGRHFGWCAAISSRNTAEGCSCGFDAALSPASGGV